MPELTGTLDTSVNGPEGLPSFGGDAWERVDWRFHEEQVRRLRSRIFKAAREGDWPLARNLQKLMLRSWSNTLVSVRQVTQRNTGRRTAGIDGQVALTSQARAGMAVHVHATIGSHRPSPVRRVYVPKAVIRQKCARSEFPRRRHSAASSSDLLGFVVVTHPFHPLNGQRLEILFAKRRAGATVFVCAGGFSGQITLPESWTDRGEPAQAHRLSAEGLAALGAVTRALQGR